MNFFKNIFSNRNRLKMANLLTEGVFLVDVRTPAEYAEGNIYGSVNIPLDQVQQKIALFKSKQNIVVYCRSGIRSAQAKILLEKNGIGNVQNGGSMEAVLAMVQNG